MGHNCRDCRLKGGVHMDPSAKFTWIPGEWLPRHAHSHVNSTVADRLLEKNIENYRS